MLLVDGKRRRLDEPIVIEMYGLDFRCIRATPDRVVLEARSPDPKCESVIAATERARQKKLFESDEQFLRQQINQQREQQQQQPQENNDHEPMNDQEREAFQALVDHRVQRAQEHKEQC
jgi:hypothetical protein